VSRVASVEISGDGEALVNVMDRIKCNLSDDARIINKNKELQTNGCKKKAVKQKKVDTRYINLKIKNNSI